MEYDPVLERTLAHALRYLERLGQASVSTTASLSELRARLVLPLEYEGMDAARVIDELVSGVEGGILGTAGGRFFGWLVGGAVPAALAADWLTSTWDQPNALYASAPAESVIEEACGRWLKELMGLPSEASFAFVTGCQMAHVTCLAAARHALLARRGWDVERRGMGGAPAIRIVSGDQRHGSIERAIRLLGIGGDNVVDLPVDARGRLEAGELARALRTGSHRPTVVVLQAGDINIGAYDPFAELIPIAHEREAWVHVDGAYGLWAAASPAYRYLLSGAAQADSWATDGHKWLNVPYDCGYAFVAEQEALLASMSHHASYLTHADEGRDQLDWTPEWSHRGRAVATYAAIRQLGKKGVAELIERCCRHARRLTARIGALPGAELVWESQINQGLVRFPSDKPGATRADHDSRTDAVIEGIAESGEAFFSGTTWRGRRCMRVSVCNWRTDDADVDRAVEAVRRRLTAP